MAYFAPLILIVCANTFYNIATKSTPYNVPPMFFLTIVYLLAAAMSAGLYFLSPERISAGDALARVNWTAPLLALTLIGLEAGYILLYRAGWKMSVGSLSANVLLAVILIALSVTVYHESIGPRELAGIGCCILGLFLINF